MKMLENYNFRLFKEIRDKRIERLKRVILNAATHGIEIQDQILQDQKINYWYFNLGLFIIITIIFYQQELFFWFYENER